MVSAITALKAWPICIALKGFGLLVSITIVCFSSLAKLLSSLKLFCKTVSVTRILIKPGLTTEIDLISGRLSIFFIISSAIASGFLLNCFASCIAILVEKSPKT